MVVGKEVNSHFIPVKKSIKKANSWPMATRLQEMSVPGMGYEFQAYRSSSNASNATRTILHSFVIMQSLMLKYRHSCLTSIGL